MKVHPECREDEVFLTNIPRSKLDTLAEWETLRVGTKLFDFFGRPMDNTEDDLVPVLVGRQEYIERNGAGA